MDNSIIPLLGISVSLDICDSTKIFEKISNKEGESVNSDGERSLYQVIDKVQKAIVYALSSSPSGQLVRFTGDGALIFFAEPLGMLSSETALNFAINFINVWKKCTCWFSALTDIKFRVCLDRGRVVTNPDGGLWSGLTLNRASKMRHSNHLDQNRVTISKTVFETIGTDSIYHNLFTNSDVCPIGESNVQLFNISFTASENTMKYNIGSDKIPLCVCILGINVSFSRLSAVLFSISRQSLIPDKVILISANENNMKIKQSLKFNYDLLCLDENEYTNKERANIRNVLMQKALECDSVEIICFLDGDTMISHSCLEVAHNLYKANGDCVLGVPRIDFDVSLNDFEVQNLAKSFLERGGEFTLPNDFSYWGATSEQHKGKSNITNFLDSYTFLGSYALFVPVSICRENGLWDVNFQGWGEEDIDFTYRIYLRGYRLLLPNIKGFLCLHLNHKNPENENGFMENATYLLSKYTELRKYRVELYRLLGFE